MEEAVGRREEITPELLRILAETAGRAKELAEDGDYMAHIYAMFLLAQFREVRAYPLVLRLASLPGDILDSLCGDFIASNLGQVLASVCGGDLGGIQHLIENEDIDEWARGSAVRSLVILVAAGQKSRDEIVDYFAQLYRCRHSGERCATFPDRPREAQDGAERTMPVRQRQVVQEVPRKLNSHAAGRE